jgi:glycerophosphoryl diester phosphodiesterase
MAEVTARLSARWARPSSRPLLLGHRGARHAAPENTFAAFDLALEEGAEGIELDVRQNADGEVVVCHDLTLERVTEGRDTRAIHALSSSQCREVRLGQGQALPFLSEVIEWAERHQACLNVEIKADGPKRRQLVRAVAQLTEQRAASANLLVSCFNPLIVLSHAKLAPRVPTAWLIDSARLAGSVARLWTRGAALHPKQSLITTARMREWKGQGRRIHVWTVNDPARACELAALGVDCLISDNPALLLRALDLAAGVTDPQPRRGELLE